MNERLQEINNLVDECFINKKPNYYSKIIDEEAQYINVNKKEFIKFFETDKMNNIDMLFNIDSQHFLFSIINKSKYYFYAIKHYNKDINNMQITTLSRLYISIIYSLNKNLLKNFSKKYISYCYQYEQYMNRFSNKKQRTEIFMYMNDNYKNNNKLLDIVKNNKPIIINLDDIDIYKKTIIEIKQEISNIYLQLNSLIDINDDNHKIFYNIINTYQNKIEQSYKFISKFNYPEMVIYNFIVEKMNENPNILNILTHFTLPIKRQSVNHPLFADLLVIIQLNESCHFIIIEYDGPTHNNIDDFRFVDSIVLCDITKNKFCYNNNISLFRLNYKINMNEHLNTINKLIDQIFKYNKPVYYSIPSDEYYEQLLINYYAKNNNI